MANPLKWPSFEQLGREFYEHLKPALDQLATNHEELDDEASRSLSQLQKWLDAPCVATVKLDGTNVGVNNEGLIVGRNFIVEPGATYQKVDVRTLLSSYPDKAESLSKELTKEAGGETVCQVMLYGELLVNNKHDYSKAGILKDWLCFGAMVCPDAEDDDASWRLATSLRASGYNVRTSSGSVILTPNLKLMALMQNLGIRTVSDAYQPSASITSAQWAEHDGNGSLPYFTSLRQLLLSEWAKRFLLPDKGPPLGEGLVVASEADGKLFKWKHGGEDLGKAPDLLREAVTVLRGLATSAHAGILTRGLLEVFERLLLVAVTIPGLEKGKEESTSTDKRGSPEDKDALAVWASALTKFDVLEAAFEQGARATSELQQTLIEQVSGDLEKDYGCIAQDALKRATKVVRKEMGKRSATWKRTAAL